MDVERLQTPAVQRDLVVDQGPEHVQHGRLHHGRRRVEVVGRLRRRAGEVDPRRARFAVDGNGDGYLAPVVERVGESAVGKRVEDPAHHLLGVVLNVAHVGLDDVEAELADDSAEFLDALLVGGDLRPEVGEVPLHVPRRPGSGGEELARLRLPERAAVDEEEVVDQHAFLVDARRVRRDRARRDSPDLGVMGARTDEEQRRLAPAVEHRRHDRDVREVRAAVVGRVQGVYVAGLHRAPAFPDDRGDALAHGAEVDRNVGRVRHEAARGVEYRAREVQAFLDVDGVRGVLEDDAHLFGDGHEQVVEYLQHDRVHVRADGGAGVPWRHPLEDETTARGRRGPPAGLDDGGTVGLDDDRGAGEPVSRAHLRAVDDGRLAPPAPGERRRRFQLRNLVVQPAGEVVGNHGIGDVGPAAGRLDDRRLDDESPVGRDEAVTPPMGFLETGGDLLEGARIDL